MFVKLNEVELFLKTAKNEIRKGHRKFIGNRQVTYDNKRVSAIQALLDLGITSSKQIWSYILELEPQECIGISRDRDFRRDLNDDMYIFKTMVNDIETYIKLSINNEGTVCLSFHKSRY